MTEQRDDDPPSFLRPTPRDYTGLILNVASALMLLGALAMSATVILAADFSGRINVAIMIATVVLVMAFV